VYYLSPPFCLEVIPPASAIPTEYVSGVPDDVDSVQEFLEYLLTVIGISASPGFTWGGSGTINGGSWLLNDTVPANRTGRTIYIYNAEIVQIFSSNEIISTYTLGLYEHNKYTDTFTQVATLPVTADYGDTIDLIDTPVTKGLELAMKVETGSGRNITAGVLMKGTTEP